MSAHDITICLIIALAVTALAEIIRAVGERKERRRMQALRMIADKKKETQP